MAKNGINTLVLDAPCNTKNIVDVAFVIDATGSMSDEINFIKSDLNSVIYNSQTFIKMWLCVTQVYSIVIKGMST